MLDKILERRIKFLIDAARFEGKKDQVVTYAMRVLSNHAAIGKDANSAQIKKINRRVSKGAYSLLMSSSIDVYCKETINEHPRPLEQTWQWLKENATELSVLDVWDEFVNNPMITITKIEDRMIIDSGQRSKGDLNSRYKELGIEIMQLEKTPYDLISEKGTMA